MNVERLNALCKSLKSDFQKNDLLSFFQNTVNSLQNLVRQSNATTQNDLASNLKGLYAALENSDFNGYSPSWRQIISELRSDVLLGNELKIQIESILSENTITLSLALEQLTKLNIALKQFHDAISDLSNACDILKIGSEQLTAGDAEIGVLIPRKYVQNRLEQFGNEIKEINLILSTFSEFTTGKKEKLEVRTISSTDLSVYVGLLPVTAACLAKTVSWIVETYKNILEIRKLKMDLKKAGVPDHSLNGIADHTNKVMSDEIDKMVINIDTEYCAIKDDTGRRNELKSGLKICLNKIANRIDKGFNIEV